MSLSVLIQKLESFVTNPNIGLPNEIFYFISRNTPLVNVDLLIVDEKDRVLLTWREDTFTGSGWHIPGGIIRVGESAVSRINKVAELELHAEVTIQKGPLFVHEFINKKNSDRCHFISLPYRCRMCKDFKVSEFNESLPDENRGHAKWFEIPPVDTINIQKSYLKKLWNFL